MADEAKSIEKLTAGAKAALLEAITTSAGEYGDPVALQNLAQAFAAVAGAGPVKGGVD